MSNSIAEKEKKKIVRIRLSPDSVRQLDELAKGVNMETTEMMRFVMLSLHRCKPENFHKVIAAMIDVGADGA